MQNVKEQRFTFGYREALAEHQAQRSESTLQRAREFGSLAHSLGVLSHELIVIHALAMNAIVPEGRVNELTDSVEFLNLVLQTLDWEVRLRNVHLKRMAAHELRTPLLYTSFQYSAQSTQDQGAHVSRLSPSD
jgi:signal transduction histidine kinase